MIEKQDNFCHLLSMHNIAFNFKLMRGLRQAISEGRVDQYVEKFINNYYSQRARIPSWVQRALEVAQLKV